MCVWTKEPNWVLAVPSSVSLTHCCELPVSLCIIICQKHLWFLRSRSLWCHIYHSSPAPCFAFPAVGARMALAQWGRRQVLAHRGAWQAEVKSLRGLIWLHSCDISLKDFASIEMMEQRPSYWLCRLIKSLRPSAPLEVPALLGRMGLCASHVEWPGSTSAALVFCWSAGLSFGL